VQGIADSLHLLTGAWAGRDRAFDVLNLEEHGKLAE
jgi:hypothetical protein